MQNNITDVEMANALVSLSQISFIDVQLNEVKLFNSISPSQMAEYQKRDTQLSIVYEYVANNYKPKLSKIHCVRSKPIRHLLLQYGHLSLIRGVLHNQTFLGTMMKFNNSFFLFLCTINFCSHFMMTMVIKVVGVYQICYVIRSIG